MYELQKFGERLKAALRDDDDESFTKGAIAVAWTFGGKVPLKFYDEEYLSGGFSNAFINAVESWFHLEMLQDFDMSVATSWRMQGFEPFVRSGFAENFVSGQLHLPVWEQQPQTTDPVQENETDSEDIADVFQEMTGNLNDEQGS